MMLARLENVLSLWSGAVLPYLNGEQHSYSIFTDRSYHIVEHIHTFHTILDYWVLLTV